MFNSISNNFGAGVIRFKSYQAPNYVVLNAKFSFDPTNAQYQACEQLEIKVPDLSIDRSGVAGVFVRFIDTQSFSWGDYVYDGGSILKSWIQDKNTLVIEKQSWFDEMGPLTIYIYALYPQLNQGSNVIKGTKRRLTMTTVDDYLYFSSDTFAVNFDHWSFIHLQFTGVAYAYRDALWEVTMEQLPDDITADVPVVGGGNQFHDNCDGMAECHIGNRVLTLERRGAGFFNTGHDPFVFAFLVRGDNE